MSVRDIAIVGGGPAGLTAALYASRAGLSTLILESLVPGGQIATTDLVENYPGLGKTTGPDLAQRLLEDALRFGAQLRAEEVQELILEQPFRLVTPGGEHLARTVIVATGSRPRTLGVPGEEELRGKGISYCATCDGAFFRDEEVAVIGGGNAAVQEALFLTRFARRVTIIHRRDTLRAVKDLADRAEANEGISFLWDSIVTDIGGSQQVEKVTVQNVKSGQKDSLPVSGVFIYIGALPNTEFLPSEITRDQLGYLEVDQDLMSSVPGVFVAGDVRPKKLRQVVTATGDGARAAMAALDYLEAM